MAPRTHSQSHPTYTIHHLETLTLLSANSSTTTTTTPTTATTPCASHTNHDNHNSQDNSLHIAASTLAVSAPMAGKLLHAAGDELVAVAAGRRHLTPLHHNNSQPHEYNHHKHQPQLQPQRTLQRQTTRPRQPQHTTIHNRNNHDNQPHGDTRLPNLVGAAFHGGANMTSTAPKKKLTSPPGGAISPVTLTAHQSDRQHSETQAQNEAQGHQKEVVVGQNYINGSQKESHIAPGRAISPVTLTAHQSDRQDSGTIWLWKESR